MSPNPIDQGSKMRKILAVSIGQPGEDEEGMRKLWERDVIRIPHFWYTDGWKPYPPMTISLDRIVYLASRRNEAVKLAIDAHPDSTDILMLDSHYANQTSSIKRLTDDYLSIADREVVLGGATWGRVRVRASHVLFGASKRWYDSWAVPDCRFIPYGWSPSKDAMVSKFKLPLPNLYRVSSAGGAYVYPRWLFEKVGYHAIEDLHGCEHNYLCEMSGLPTYVDFNAPFWRYLTYPVLKCFRVSAGAWKRRMLRTGALQQRAPLILSETETTTWN